MVDDMRDRQAIHALTLWVFVPFLTLLLLVLWSAGGCAFELTDAELEMATAPVEDPIELRDPDDMLDDFAAAGRPPRIREQGTGYTVMPDELLLPPDWHERPDDGRQRSLAHEWAHVVDDVKPGRWAASRRYRARVEMRGQVERARAALRQGGGVETCAHFVRETFGRLPHEYAVRLRESWLREVAIPRAIEGACSDG